MSSSGVPEDGEASSPGRAVSGTAELPRAVAAPWRNTGTAHGTTSAIGRAAVVLTGPTVRLPEDGVAVEWWLTRRAVEDEGAMPYAPDRVLDLWSEHGTDVATWTFGLEF